MQSPSIVRLKLFLRADKILPVLLYDIVLECRDVEAVVLPIASASTTTLFSTYSQIFKCRHMAIREGAKNALTALLPILKQHIKKVNNEFVALVMTLFTTFLVCGSGFIFCAKKPLQPLSLLASAFCLRGQQTVLVWAAPRQLSLILFFTMFVALPQESEGSD